MRSYFSKKNKKRFFQDISVILVAVSLVFSSADVYAATRPVSDGYVVYETRMSSLGSRSYWQKMESRYYYKKLDSTQKKIYNGLHESCMRVLTSKTNVTRNRYGMYVISANTKGVNVYGRSKAYVNKVWQYFMNENPEFYFLDPGFWLSTARSTSGIHLMVNEDFVSGSKRAKYTKKLIKGIKSYTSVASKEESTINKEHAIHDLIAYRVDYDVFAPYNQTVASAFFYKASVCTGYAQTFTLLTNYMGFTTITVTSPDHAWNKIKIGKNWYNVDCTYDDQIVPIYDFFNISDKNLKKLDSYHHTPDSVWKGMLPKCSKDFTYYDDGSDDNSAVKDGVEIRADIPNDSYMDRTILGAAEQEFVLDQTGHLLNGIKTFTDSDGNKIEADGWKVSSDNPSVFKIDYKKDKNGYYVEYSALSVGTGNLIFELSVGGKKKGEVKVPFKVCGYLSGLTLSRTESTEKITTTRADGTCAKVTLHVNNIPDNIWLSDHDVKFLITSGGHMKNLKMEMDKDKLTLYSNKAGDYQIDITIAGCKLHYLWHVRK